MPEIKVRFDEEPADGQLVSIREVDIEAATAVASRREIVPVLASETGLMRKLSNFAVNVNLTAEHLDLTGKEPKITMTATVNALVAEINKNPLFAEKEKMVKACFISVACPNTFSLSVVKGHGVIYSNPACNTPEHSVRGMWRETKGQTAFLNNICAQNVAKMSACAVQMAKWFYEACISAPLHGTRKPVLAPMNMRGRDEEPTHEITCALAPDLKGKHGVEVISLIYNALESKEVLAAAGYDTTVNHVWNSVQNCGPVTVAEDIFWEGYKVLKFSCGDEQAAKKFDCEFLLAVASVSSLHGNTDEGGIWRNLFKNIQVEPNRIVAVSPFNASTSGYNDIDSGTVISACANLQSIVSRALSEVSIAKRMMVLEPGCTNEDYLRVQATVMNEICDHMAAATVLGPEFFEQRFCVEALDPALRDRHFSPGDRATIVANYSPYLSTYSVDDVGSEKGRFEYDKESTMPLKFTGDFAIEKYIDRGRVYVLIDISQARNFKDGLCFLDPKLNRNNPLGECIVKGRIDSSGNFYEDTTLVDGQVLKRGETLGDKLWRDNGCLFPSYGDANTTENGKIILEASGLPEWAFGAAYEVKVTRYAFCTRMSGEDEKSTRRMKYESKVHNSSNVKYGTKPPEIKNVAEYLRKVKKQSIGRSEARVAELARKKLYMDERIDELYGETIDRLVEDSDKVNAASLGKAVAKVVLPVFVAEDAISQVHSGEAEITDKSTKSKLVAAKAIMLRDEKVRFVSIEDLTVRTPGKPDTMVSELKYGSSKQLRRWNKNTYSQEVTDVLYECSALARQLVTLVGSNVLAKHGINEQEEYYEGVRAVTDFAHKSAEMANTYASFDGDSLRLASAIKHLQQVRDRESTAQQDTATGDATEAAN
ncbi:hypothetical protein RVD_107 [viral metagenome]